MYDIEKKIRMLIYKLIVNLKLSSICLIDNKFVEKTVKKEETRLLEIPKKNKFF